MAARRKCRLVLVVDVDAAAAGALRGLPGFLYGDQPDAPETGLEVRLRDLGHVLGDTGADQLQDLDPVVWGVEVHVDEEFEDDDRPRARIEF